MSWSLTACQQSFTDEPLNRKTPLFEFASDHENRMKISAAARQAISEQGQIPAEDLIVVSAEKHLWNDICLELGSMDENCLPQPIEGYLVLISAVNQLFEVHTDTTGSMLRYRSVSMLNTSPQNQTMQLLATQLGIQPTEILIQSVEPAEWQDSCLEISTDITCTPMVVPGFRIILEARGQRYEYHTNQDASVIYGGVNTDAGITNQASSALSNYLTLSMQRFYLNSSLVEQLLISNDMTLSISNSEGLEKNGITLSPEEKEQLSNWKTSFSNTNFTIRDEDGQWETTIQLYGSGQDNLPEFGQEVLLNFVMDLFTRESGSGNP